MATSEANKERGDVVDIAIEMGEDMVVNPEILAARRVKWFQQKFEREAENLARNHVAANRKVEYLGGMEGISTDGDGKLVIDPGVRRSRWGKWLVKKMAKGGEERVNDYLTERRRLCELAEKVNPEPRNKWRKQQRKTRTTQKTIEKAKHSEKTDEIASNGTKNPAVPTCTLDAVSAIVPPAGGGKAAETEEIRRTSPPAARPAATDDGNTRSETSDSGVPTAAADRAVHVEAALLRSRWGQWASRQSGHSGRQENGARVREGREMGEQMARDTAEKRARWRQQLDGKDEASDNTKAKHSVKTDEIASNGTNKPAVPTSTLDAVSAIVPEAGGGKAAETEEVRRTSPPALRPTATDTGNTRSETSDSVAPTAPIDRALHVDATILRSRWGQWASRQSGLFGRQETGARVREGREMGEQVARDTAQLRARWRQQLVRNGEATKTTKVRSQSNSNNKPAVPACKLEGKSKTASPAGDSHDGNAEKVGRAETSDDSIPGAAQSDSGVHTSAVDREVHVHAAVVDREIHVHTSTVDRELHVHTSAVDREIHVHTPAVDREVHVHAAAVDSDRGSPTATKNSDSGTPTVPVDRAVHVEAALLRSRWCQWASRQSGLFGRHETGARVREGREMGEQVAQDTARLRARWRQQLVRNGQATKTTKVRSQSNSTNKPAVPACKLEGKSTTASPAGDSHDGNAEKVGRAETSDDSIPGAAQSDSGVHTSAVDREVHVHAAVVDREIHVHTSAVDREVHVHAAAIDSDSPTATKNVDSSTPTAPIDRAVHVEAALLRSRWGQWASRQSGLSEQQENGARVREGREMGEQVARDTAQQRSRWRQQLVRNGQATKTTKVRSQSNSTNKPVAPACSLEVKSTTASPAGDSHDGNAEKVGRAETSDDSIPGAAQSDSGVHTPAVDREVYVHSTVVDREIHVHTSAVDREVHVHAAVVDREIHVHAAAVDREVHVHATAVDSDRGSPTATKNSDSGTPTAPVDMAVHIEAALLRSRWGQWASRQLGHSGRRDNGARVREGREMGEQMARDTAEQRAKWRQQLDGKNESSENTKAKPNQKTDGVPTSKGANKPALPSCILNAKSSVTSPAGDGNDEKTNHGTSPPATRGASVNTSRALTGANSITSATQDKESVKARAMDTPKASVSILSHNVQGTTQHPDTSASVNKNEVDTPKVSVSIPSHNVQGTTQHPDTSASVNKNEVDTPKVSVSIPSHNVQGTTHHPDTSASVNKNEVDTPKPSVSTLSHKVPAPVVDSLRTPTPGGTDVYADSVLLALCGHFGDTLVQMSVRSDHLKDSVEQLNDSGPYMGAYSHAYDWIFGNVRSVGCRA